MRPFSTRFAMIQTAFCHVIRMVYLNVLNMHQLWFAALHTSAEQTTMTTRTF